LHTSPPRNRFTILRYSCLLIEEPTGDGAADEGVSGHGGEPRDAARDQRPARRCPICRLRPPSRSKYRLQGRALRTFIDHVHSFYSRTKRLRDARKVPARRSFIPGKSACATLCLFRPPRRSGFADIYGSRVFTHLIAEKHLTFTRLANCEVMQSASNEHNCSFLRCWVRGFSNRDLPRGSSCEKGIELKLSGDKV